MISNTPTLKEQHGQPPGSTEGGLEGNQELEYIYPELAVEETVEELSAESIYTPQYGCFGISMDNSRTVLSSRLGVCMLSNINQKVERICQVNF